MFHHEWVVVPTRFRFDWELYNWITSQVCALFLRIFSFIVKLAANKCSFAHELIFIIKQNIYIYIYTCLCLLFGSERLFFKNLRMLFDFVCSKIKLYSSFSKVFYPHPSVLQRHGTPRIENCTELEIFFHSKHQNALKIKYLPKLFTSRFHNTIFLYLYFIYLVCDIKLFLMQK